MIAEEWEQHSKQYRQVSLRYRLPSHRCVKQAPACILCSKLGTQDKVQNNRLPTYQAYQAALACQAVLATLAFQAASACLAVLPCRAVPANPACRGAWACRPSLQYRAASEVLQAYL